MNQTEFKTDVIRPVQCFKEGFAIIKEQYLILLAITVVGMVGSSFTLYILLGALICGIFKCYLQVFDGEKAEMETLFQSLKYFKPALPIVLLIVLPMIVIVLIYLPLLLATLRGEIIQFDELYNLMAKTLITEFIFATAMVCLHTLLMFAFPLIVDREMSGIEAIKTSAKAVWHNLNGVAGLWAVGFGISLVGLLIFCVGIYLTVPIVIAGNISAYRKVFPKLEI